MRPRLLRRAALGGLTAGLFLVGCDSGGGGACSEGESRCTDTYHLQTCEDGTWGEEEACPTLDSELAPIAQICDDGLCRP
jgi:hypothetical protein